MVERPFRRQYSRYRRNPYIYIHRVYSGDYRSLTFVKALPNTQASKVIHHHQQSHYPHLLSHLWIIQKPKSLLLPCPPTLLSRTRSRSRIKITADLSPCWFYLDPDTQILSRPKSFSNESPPVISFPLSSLQLSPSCFNHCGAKTLEE